MSVLYTVEFLRCVSFLCLEKASFYQLVFCDCCGGRGYVAWE